MAKKRLSREVIVDAALEVADREGVERVSIRTVARQVGAAPMALYRHFPSKSALLDFMLERVIERVFLGDHSTAETWQEARRVLGAHPSWLPLLTRSVAPVSAIAIFERFSGAMAKDSLMCFTLGFVLLERMMKHADGNLVPIEQLRRAREAWSFDAAFESGLHALVAEIDRKRVAS